MKPRFIYLIVLALIFAAAAVLPYAGEPLVTPESDEYTVYASFYPVYSVCRRIFEGVPGLKLHQLTQPTDNPISEYSLSDWDAALLEQSDVLIMTGTDEAFSAYSNSSTIIITAMSSGSYMSPEGTLELARGICAGMLSVDEDYTDAYISNLEKLEAEIGALTADYAEFIPGSKEVCVSDDSIGILLTAMGIDGFSVYDSETGIAGITADVLFCDKAFIISYGTELAAAGINTVCLDKGTAHTAGDSESWLQILTQNMKAVKAALS